MKIIGFDDLHKYNYTIDVINVLKQGWHKNKFFDCLGNPKKQNLLLYIDGCKIEYTLKSKEKLYVQSGDAVYIPIGSEYHMRTFDYSSSKPSTIGINFFIFDKNQEAFVLSENITVFKHLDCKRLFEKINAAGEVSLPNYGKMKAGIYDLMTMITESQNKTICKKYKIIEKGILYAEDSVYRSFSVYNAAKMCNVSEVYFRKLFKEYSGMSPVKYVLNAKIERAKIHLKYDDISISETADLLHFTDASYFCKIFKQSVGISPLKYKSTADSSNDMPYIPSDDSNL